MNTATTLIELREIAKKKKLTGYSTLSKNELRKYINKPVVLGIRPEDIHAEPDNNLTLQKYKAKLEVAEPMGNETVLHFVLSSSQFIARFPAIEKPQPGTDINFYIDLAKLHLFSLEDGRAIR